ncbi:phosphate transporter [Chytriomyces hyalinus]|nr:phosphate transporter [Chytriomyces hyalinus]
MAQNKAQTFAHLDEAKLSWFHIRAVLIAGAGFFSDAYDVFVISQALPMIYQVYYGPEYISGSYPANMPGFNNSAPIPKTPQNTKVNFVDHYPNGVHVDSWLKASTNWGNLFGQISFGILGDSMGRKKVYGIELMIIIVCTIGSTFSSSLVRGMSIIVMISIWRFLLGIGIGGDYPMSAVITSEYASVRYRGMMLAAVFSMQGIGILMGSVVYVLTLIALKDQIRNDYAVLDYVWRIAIGFGVIPALATVYFRFTIPETPRFTVDVNKDVEQAARDIQIITDSLPIEDQTTPIAPVSKVTTKIIDEDELLKPSKMSDFIQYFSQWKNMKILIGTAYCWFALDVAWYGLALNQSTVLSLINFNGPAKISVGGKLITPPLDIQDLFYQIAIGNILVACAGTVPGYWFTVGLIEYMGRKPIQIMGFVIITICLAILAATWETISKQQVPFLIVYTIAQFFFQFGPNSTTFIIPGEVFPTRFKATCHGISAACGKVGAIIGIQAVGPYFASNTVVVLSVFCVIMASGIVATFLLPETKGKTLEELSGDETLGDDTPFVVSS